MFIAIPLGISLVLAAGFIFWVATDHFIDWAMQDENEHFNDMLDSHESNMGKFLTKEQKAHLDDLRDRWPRKT